MKKKTKVFRAISYVLLALVIAGIAYFKYDSMPKYYELTDKEREFLNAFRDYNGRDMERFRVGMLYDFEIMQLEWLRCLYADLEARYPGYRFYISDKTVPGLFGRLGYSLYYAKEETTGRDVDIHAYFEDGDYAYEEDNFYSYFVENEYAEYIEDLLREKGIEDVVDVNCSMSVVKGKEYNSKMTLEDMVSGKLKVLPAAQMYFLARDRTEEECKAYGEIIQQKIETAIPKGHYGVYFCDMVEGEELSLEDEMEFIYIHIW